MGELVEHTQLSRSTIYNLLAAGLLPPPIQLGPRAKRWPLAEVLKVLALRTAGASHAEITVAIDTMIKKRQSYFELAIHKETLKFDRYLERKHP